MTPARQMGAGPRGVLRPAADDTRPWLASLGPSGLDPVLGGDLPPGPPAGDGPAGATAVPATTPAAPASVNGQGGAEGAPLLLADGLTVRFGRQTVLRDLCLTIRRGQTVAVIGESGCGKTVFLKTLIGLIPPTAGRVTFDGRQLADLPNAELTRQRLRFGFVFQMAALFDSMNIFENVAFAVREHARRSEREIEQTVRERLKEVGLAPEVMRKMPAEVSGGMRKRVGLARAVALDPEVMLYDEPTTGLDPIMSDVINELILKMRRSRPVTSVVVTHDMTSARKIADRVVMLMPVSRLKAGGAQVIFDGPPEALDGCDDPRVTQFIRGEARERLSEMEAA